MTVCDRCGKPGDTNSSSISVRYVHLCEKCEKLAKEIIDKNSQSLLAFCTTFEKEYKQEFGDK